MSTRRPQRSAAKKAKEAISDLLSPAPVAKTARRTSSRTPAKNSPAPKSSAVVHQNDQPRAHGEIFMTLCSLALMILTPCTAVLLIYMHEKLNGAVWPLYDTLMVNGVTGIPAAMWSLYPRFDDMVAWKIIGGFALIEAVLMVIIPGKEFKGPVAPSGHVPIYNANGFQHYFVANVLFWVTHYMGWFDFTIVYDHLMEILTYLSVTAFVLCIGLYFKGIYFPTGKDSGSTGNPIVDFFQGTELYPRIFGIDVKVFTNCRFGMMAWALLPYVYALKQLQLTGFVADTMLVSVLLQTIYIAKFFWWETGYFWSIDIMHDRAGYYICWGCLVWVPSLYTGHTLFLVNHPVNLGLWSVANLVFGILMIFLNYDADRQRYDFRQNDAKNTVWGKAPVYVQAYYVTEEGKRKGSKLLASGYWGLARHLQYDFELAAAFAWCLPAGLATGFQYPLPFFYFIFLVILLTDRAHRDDHRCGMKYGEYWTQYKALVPYNMIPGIF